MSTYQSLTDQIKKRTTKKLANNTYIVRDEENLAVRLHEMNILLFKPSGHIVVSSGGWKTVTTKARINEHLPNRRISQVKGIWYWPNGIVFTDGDSIDSKGVLKTQAKAGDPKKLAGLRKRIKEYAKLCVSKIPLDPPGGGDCFYCQGEAGIMPGTTFSDATLENGRIVTKPMNFAAKVDHLQLHIDEKYVVPALVYNAMRATPTAAVTWWGAFKGSDAMNSPHNIAFARRGVQRAVEKYLRQRLGLPL